MATRIFSFTCPSDRAGEATSLLEDIQGVTLFLHRENATDVVPDEQGNYVMNQGVEITGTCDGEQIKDIIGVLSASKIAGYSRETMVILRDTPPPKLSDKVH
jgi:hypothetical protein